MSTVGQQADFTGWHRDHGGKWRAVCRGATEDEAWAALLCADLPSGDMTVLPAGRDPNRPGQHHHQRDDGKESDRAR